MGQQNHVMEKYSHIPLFQIVMQYFRRPKIIIPLLNSLVRLEFQVEFIINDDSISRAI